ncbi:MAG TPA: hypothetical protein VND93_00155, partial [Myxococcales bacterium]|nr:hypothetical protein [Myxococcales bacterium]
LVVVGPGPGTGTRVKGAFSIAVVGEDGQELQRARPGDRVGIAVGAAGRAQVLVLAMDDHGAVEVLWPVEGKESGAAPPGARAVLGTSFDVTPGSLALYALFGNAPISAAEAQAALKSEVTTAAREGRGPLEAQAPRGPWEGAAKIVVQVAP